MEIDLQQLLESMEDRIRDDIKGVQDRLDLQNGRLRQVENRIVAVETRVQSALRTAKAAIGALGVAVMEHLRQTIWGQ